jgi:hypothetical protein
VLAFEEEYSALQRAEHFLRKTRIPNETKFSLLFIDYIRLQN